MYQVQYELVRARGTTFHLRTHELYTRWISRLDAKHILQKNASTRRTHRGRVFVYRSCISWDMGRCFGMQISWAGGETNKWWDVRILDVNHDFFADSVTIQRYLLLDLRCYGTSTLSNGLGWRSVWFRKKHCSRQVWPTLGVVSVYFGPIYDQNCSFS